MKRFIFFVVSLVTIFALVTSCGRQSEDKLFKSAEKLEMEEKFEDALVKYERILVDYPNTQNAAEVYFRIATISGNLKQYQKCVDSYEQIVTLTPNDSIAPKAQFMIGYIYANEIKNLTKARKAYEDFIQKYSAVDSGMTSSAQFELKYMGKDISEIDFLNDLATKETAPAEKKSKGK